MSTMICGVDREYWTTERLANAERIIRSGIKRAMIARDGEFDPLVADELAAEAIGQVWLLVPPENDLEPRWRDDDGEDGLEWARLRVACWRAVRAVLSGHWLAGRPIESKQLRKLLGRMDSETAGRLREWRTIGPEAFDAMWAAVWERFESQLSTRQYRVAERLVAGLSVETIAEALGVSKRTAYYDAHAVRSVAEETARQFGSWRF